MKIVYVLFESHRMYVIFGSGQVLTGSSNWKMVVISIMLCNIIRVVHSLDPGATPVYSVSNTDLNYMYTHVC